MELEKSVKRQVKDTMEYYKVLDNLEEVPIDILRVMYKDLLENSIPKEKIENMKNKYEKRADELYLRFIASKRLNADIRDEGLSCDKVAEVLQELLEE